MKTTATIKAGDRVTVAHGNPAVVGTAWKIEYDHGFAAMVATVGWDKGAPTMLPVSYLEHVK
jgi:hypothetical protein